MDAGIENELKKGNEEKGSEVLSDKDIFPVTNDVKESDPAEKEGTNNVGESLKSTEETPAEEAAASEQGDISGNEVTDANENLEVKTQTATEQPSIPEQIVASGINSEDKDEWTTVNQDTEEKAREEPAPADKENISLEEYKQLLQELSEQRDKAREHNSQLQVKLVEYFSRKGVEEDQVEPEELVSEQLKEYERYLNTLSDLKHQMSMKTELFQQQEEELKAKTQEKLDQVENKWREFMTLKQDVAVSVLSRHLGKQAAQAKVEQILKEEQNQQDELRKLSVKYVKLKFKIQGLEAGIRDEDRHMDPFQIQFERLMKEKLKQRRQMEKQNEESLKMEKKISSSVEVLSNIKEKLSWNQMDVKAKREQLAEVEATLAVKRDTLSRIKKSRKELQRDNEGLKERRGLIGNMALLRDFEDTSDATEILEKKLEKLKGRQAEIVFNSGRCRNRLEKS